MANESTAIAEPSTKKEAEGDMEKRTLRAGPEVARVAHSVLNRMIASATAKSQEVVNAIESDDPHTIRDARADYVLLSLGQFSDPENCPIGSIEETQNVRDKRDKLGIPHDEPVRFNDGKESGTLTKITGKTKDGFICEVEADTKDKRYERELSKVDLMNAQLFAERELVLSKITDPSERVVIEAYLSTIDPDKPQTVTPSETLNKALESAARAQGILTVTEMTASPLFQALSPEEQKKLQGLESIQGHVLVSRDGFNEFLAAAGITRDALTKQMDGAIQEEAGTRKQLEGLDAGDAGYRVTLERLAQKSQRVAVLSAMDKQWEQGERDGITPFEVLFKKAEDGDMNPGETLQVVEEFRKGNVAPLHKLLQEEQNKEQQATIDNANDKIAKQIAALEKIRDDAAATPGDQEKAMKLLVGLNVAAAANGEIGVLIKQQALEAMKGTSLPGVDTAGIGQLAEDLKSAVETAQKKFKEILTAAKLDPQTLEKWQHLAGEGNFLELIQDPQFTGLDGLPDAFFGALPKGQIEQLASKAVSGIDSAVVDKLQARFGVDWLKWLLLLLAIPAVAAAGIAVVGAIGGKELVVYGAKTVSA